MQWGSAMVDHACIVALRRCEAHDVLFPHRAKRIQHLEVFASAAEPGVETERENLVYGEDRMEH